MGKEDKEVNDNKGSLAGSADAQPARSMRDRDDVQLDTSAGQVANDTMHGQDRNKSAADAGEGSKNDESHGGRDAAGAATKASAASANKSKKGEHNVGPTKNGK